MKNVWPTILMILAVLSLAGLLYTVLCDSPERATLIGASLGFANAAFGIVYFWERLRFDRSNQIRSLKTKRIEDFHAGIMELGDLASSPTTPLQFLSVRMRAQRLLGEVECLESTSFIGPELRKAAVFYLNAVSTLAELGGAGTKKQRESMQQKVWDGEVRLLTLVYEARGIADISI